MNYVSIRAVRTCWLSSKTALEIRYYWEPLYATLQHSRDCHRSMQEMALCIDNRNDWNELIFHSVMELHGSISLLKHVVMTANIVFKLKERTNYVLHSIAWHCAWWPKKIKFVNLCEVFLQALCGVWACMSQIVSSGKRLHDDIMTKRRFTGPCITNVFATCRKNFSQWESSFLWKLRCHWLKFLQRVAKTLVIQGPACLRWESNGHRLVYAGGKM